LNQEPAKVTATATDAAGRPAVVAIAPADAGTPDPARIAPVAPLAGSRDSIDDPSATAEAQLRPPAVSTADLPPAAVEQPTVAPATAGRESARASDPVSSVAPPVADTLDVTSLLTRLRKTKAINLRTKLAVKNESDDLMERFRAYHAQHGTATLAELRRSYDSLFLKLNSLLADGDPRLASDINRSRAAIWAILADPMRFRTSASVVATRGVPPA
jgi:hypothetical protein